MVVYLNGKFIPEETAHISINSRGFRYGDGFFETMRMVAGRLLIADYHIDRLFNTLNDLAFTIPIHFTKAEIIDRIMHLTGRNKVHKSARIRLTIFRSDGGLYDPIHHHPQILIQCWPLPDNYNYLNINGLVIGSFKDGIKSVDKFSGLKTNSHLLYSMAALFAKDQQLNDVLVLNAKGSFADSTIANLWIINGKHAITPPISDGPVMGTMRRALIDLLPTIGFTVEEASIRPENMLTADECFLSNAIYGIKWVQQFENKTFKFHHSDSIYKQLVQKIWQIP